MLIGVIRFNWHGLLYLLEPRSHSVTEVAMMMPMDTVNDERIDSWKEISSYLGRDVSTVIRWEKEKALPVHRIPGGRRQSVFAYRHELDQWMVGLDPTNGVKPSPTSEIKTITAPAIADDIPAQVAAPTAVEISQPLKRQQWRRALYLAAGLLVVVSAYPPTGT